MMTVKKTGDTAQTKIFLHRIADIPGGVSVKGSVLGGDFLFAGTPIGAPTSGVCSVVKYAKVLTEVAADAVTIDVAKGHHFKVGDVVMAAAGAKAHTITAVDKTTSTAKDTLTIDITIGTVIAVNAYIYEAAAVNTSTGSALKVTAQSMVGTGVPVVALDNVTTDAWLIGVTTNNAMPSAITTLTHIINI